MIENVTASFTEAAPDQGPDQLTAPLKSMIASVTEQQAASVNSAGSAMSAGEMNNENDVPKNLNGSSNNQSFGHSNGMRNGDSFEFEKFKNINIANWQLQTCTPKLVEWIRCEKDFLINRIRVLIEVRITENYDVIIHAHGRRVFPESIGVHFIDHNIKSITEFLISLSQIKFCQGFPAPLYRPLEVQGHLVSAVEIWSRRTDEDTEEIRHRALNCALMFNSEGSFCSSCFHICRLNMQRVTNSSNSTNDSNASPISSLN